MKCFVCGIGTMRVQSAIVEANVRGESFRVQVEAEVCDHCGETVLTDAQADAYSIASADAYRRAHGLLTTDEFKAARKRLGLSQRAFACRLGVGVNSVKRWEAGAIQDESSDRLIRLCTDVEAARTNLRELESALPIESRLGPVPVTVQAETRSDWAGFSPLTGSGPASGRSPDCSYAA
ncbi:MAG: type II toxin-antitoxin system MqsA family antitoxin [Bryobacteraceae bacterium]|nr:type II toxin-antitoxin system MqsA family antitoxin [Bryobacteraceae bacterium]